MVLFWCLSCHSGGCYDWNFLFSTSTEKLDGVFQFVIPYLVCCTEKGVWTFPNIRYDLMCLLSRILWYIVGNCDWSKIGGVEWAEWNDEVFGWTSSWGLGVASKWRQEIWFDNWFHLRNSIGIYLLCRSIWWFVEENKVWGIDWTGHVFVSGRENRIAVAITLHMGG